MDPPNIFYILFLYYFVSFIPILSFLFWSFVLILPMVSSKIWHSFSYLQMTPLHVSTHLCGGGCHTASHSCISTEQTTLHIPVLLSSCGLTSGMCSKTCSTVAIQEDTACRCGCSQEQEACISHRQAFNINTCMCECKEEEEYTMCRDKDRVWDYQECVCSCPLELVKPCPTGWLNVTPILTS